MRVMDSLAVHEDANEEIEPEHLRKLIEQAVELGEALTPDTIALIAIERQRWVLEVEQHVRSVSADPATEAVPSQRGSSARGGCVGGSQTPERSSFANSGNKGQRCPRE